MIKRIIFDLDGTLIYGNYDKLGSYYKEIDKNIDIDFVDNFNYYLLEYENSNINYSYDKLFYFLSNKVNYKLDYGNFLRVINYSSNILNNDLIISIDILKKLSMKYEIYILTNWFYDVQIKKMDTVGISKYITKVISGDMILKPNRKAYELCAKGINSDECVFIGDNYYKDVINPFNYGYKSIWYNPNHEENMDNVMEINDFIDIINVIERL